MRRISSSSCSINSLSVAGALSSTIFPTPPQPSCGPFTLSLGDSIPSGHHGVNVGGEFVDYSDLLRRAWRVAWRHKYLWLLGLVASEGGCGISGGAPNISYSFGSYQGYGPFASGSLDLADWIAHNWPFLLALIVGLFLLGIVLWVISIIATGGLIAGSDAANAEGPSGLGFAWSAGVRSFWRLLGMWLLVAVVALAIGLLFALAIGLPLGLALARGAHLGTGVICLLYTSDAADDLTRVDLGGRR